MSQMLQDNFFPSVMREKLRSIRWRQAGLSAARAFAFALTVLLSAMIAAMILDWALTLFDTRIRILLTTITLLSAILTLLALGVRPVVKAFGWIRAAGDVDDRVPVLEERWRTVTGFAQSHHQPASAIAQAMLRQVTSEAVAMSTLVRPRHIVQSVSLRRSGMALSAACLALLAFMLLNLPLTSVLMRRFWSPSMNISATQLESVTGDSIVPRGHSIEIVARMKGVQRSSGMISLTPENDPRTEELELVPSAEKPGLLSTVVDVDESFRYRVQAGDGRTEWHTVTAIDFPKLSEVRLTVTPPRYVDEPPSEKTLIPGRIRAIQGSELELAMKPEQELKSLTLMLTIPRPANEAEATTSPDTDEDSEAEAERMVSKPVLLTRGEDGWYHFATSLTESLTFSPVLVSPHGLTGENPRVCRIEVIEDRAPVARIISPDEQSSVSPDESIEIRFEAHDDHGIATAELVVYDSEVKDGEEPEVLAVIQIPLGDQELQKHVMGKTVLNLKELGLEEGRSISYAVRVTDNRQLEMDPADSQSRMIAAADEQTTPQSDDSRNSSEAGSDVDNADTSTDSTNETSLAAQNGSRNVEDAGTFTASGTTADDSDSDSDEPAATSETGAGADADADADAEDTPGIKRKLTASTPENVADAKEAKNTEDEPRTGEPKTGESQTTPNNVTSATSPTPDGAGSPDNNANPSDGPAPGDKAASDLNPAAESNDRPGNPTDRADTDIPEDDAPAGDAPVGDAPAEDEAADDRQAEPLKREVSRTGSTDEEPAEASDSDTIPADAKSQASATSEANRSNVNGGSGDPNFRPTSEEPARNEKNAQLPMANSPGNVPAPKVQATLRQSNAGQQEETDRRQLRISERLDAVARRSEEQLPVELPVREKVVQIDRMLETIEGKLNALYRHEVEETLRGEGFAELDVRLGDVESFVTELKTETLNTAFEFVGLQMVDISSNHVTPSRDAVFVAIRRPDSGADVHAEEALHHIVSARELLQALLQKYDNVARERELAKKIDEAIKIYTVYVEGTQQLLREAQQDFDPLRLQRELAVVEVDQAYLDRLAEVTRMRRDMISELAKILADDPRLRSRYLDLIKRRRASLRSRLAELASRQDQSTQEVLGWRSVAENQRDSYWRQISDLRLDLPKELAKDAQQVADRVEKQLPLVLDAAQGTAAATIQLAKQIAVEVRRCDFEVRAIRKADGEVTTDSKLSLSANDLADRISELTAALDQMRFEGNNQDEISDYAQLRLAEVRSLADQAHVWAETAIAIEQKSYAELAHMDQHQLTIATELLRMEMLNIEADLTGQFNQENRMPPEITGLTQELMSVMESLTFNQSSATFGFASDQLESAAAQQELAMQGFEKAGKLLDQLRRKTIEALDKEEVPDPTVADLVDPTLDQFLANLEREPDIESQLGIPIRPRNIRVLQDAMVWSQNGNTMLGASRDAAEVRMQQMQRTAEQGTGEKPTEKPQDVREMTDEERKELAESKDMQQMLKDQMQQSLKDIQNRDQDPATSEEQRRQLQEMAQRMNQALEEMKEPQTPEQLWRRRVEADLAKSALEALAKGEVLPDDQWNKLMSTLDDGLGQVGGKTPPEDYRKSIEQYQQRLRQLTGHMNR